MTPRAPGSVTARRLADGWRVGLLLLLAMALWGCVSRNGDGDSVSGDASSLRGETKPRAAVIERPTPSGMVTVSEVIDGDTLRLASGDKVRLLGIDTPESKSTAKDLEFYGKEASAFCRDLLTGKPVRLEFEEERTDKYGRLVAYVFLDDGTLVNALLIKEGYARCLGAFRFSRKPEFKSLHQEAKAAERGLWNPEGRKRFREERKAYWATTDRAKRESPFIGNKRAKTLHLGTCGRLPSVPNRTFFDKAPEALDHGYSAAGCCRDEIEASLREPKPVPDSEPETPAAAGDGDAGGQ